MSKPYIIAIAGIPASGKTVYGRHLAEKMNIPFISKDAIKEKLHDVLKFDNTARENSQLYGAASYSVFYHITECLMKTKISFILESNFHPMSVEKLSKLTEEYGYNAVTVLFDADIQVLHKRFVERDLTEERHPGLVSIIAVENSLNDFEVFKTGTAPLREFCIGKKIVVDTTDFSKVSYEEVDKKVLEAITNEHV